MRYGMWGGGKISVLSHGSALTMLTNSSVPVRTLQLKLALDFKDLTKTEVMWCC